jgi:hypothetical protein
MIPATVYPVPVIVLISNCLDFKLRMSRLGGQESNDQAIEDRSLHCGTPIDIAAMPAAFGHA